ncbi:sugar ABC transporter permease [Micrococcales bacterium 31B]|nr:sugar ABC transporter permease [Micrococcales bacterium 31B]
MSTTLSTPGRTIASPPRTVTQKQRDRRDGLTMVAPIFVIVFAIIIVPIVWSVVLSFQHARYIDVARNGVFNTLTLENYTDVFTSRGFWRSLWTTIVYTVSTTLGSILVGLAAALAFRKKFWGRGPLRAIMLLPYVAPVVAAAFIWEVMLNPQYGIVNAVGTTYLGWDEPINFLGTAPIAMYSVIVFEIWRYFPFAFMFLAAAITGLSRDVEEAATVDGATPLQTFRYVILPQLMPTVALLTLLRMIMSFNKFDDIFLLTGGAAGTEVAAVRVYNQLVGSNDIGAASANAVILAIILIVGLILYQGIVLKTGGKK